MEHNETANMRPEEVTQYLQRHPEFLEDFVTNYVNKEQLERWARHQTHHHSASQCSLRHHHDNQHLANGEVSTERRLSSLDKWKSRIQSSKARLLQELSRERTEGEHSKLPVLLQLSACVASAISAEDHNLYTLDEKTKIFREDSDGSDGVDEESTVAGSSRATGNTDTVTAHVALTREAVRVTDLSQIFRQVSDGSDGVDEESTVAESSRATGNTDTVTAHVALTREAVRVTDLSQIFRQVSDGSDGVDEESTVAESSRATGNTDTVTAHVALTREAVRVTDLSQDCRFPGGLGLGFDNQRHHHHPHHHYHHHHPLQHKKEKNVTTAVSVLALPVCDASNTLLGVVEFYRSSQRPFTEEEEEVAMYMMLWSDMFLAYTEMHGKLSRQRKLNDFLLAVTKSIFQDISMDTVIMKIMSFAQKLVSADRASIFLLDHDSRELYARIFDVGSGTDTSGPLVTTTPTPTQHIEIRFPMDRGVAGHVATTGEILNIPDAYADDRFNRDVDLQTGYRTKTILCMPIYIRENVIGVVQMVNKKSGTFTRTDEESFETFAVYCGLALHHAKLYDKIRRSEQKYRVALEVLSYHSQATEEELNHLRALPIPEHIPSVTDYKFSPWSVDGDRKPLYVLFMFRDLFSQMRYDLEDLMRFTLTVRRNYRNVPYHNWVHAFSVAHSMYTVLKTCRHQLSHLQCLALFVACLCHDLDHRGKTNSFMVKSCSPLAAVYSTTSTMEHHHFNQTVTILQHEGHNIFKHLTSEEYKQVLGNIRHSILATDLALFFTNHACLKDVMASTGFSWDVREHRHLLMGVTMTACDLCAMFKPWRTQLDLVYVIMEEFWQQGDEEKAQGLTPMAMMDRDKQNELPQLEVGFILGICLPCYGLLADVMPESQPMLTGVTDNLKQWQQLAEEHKSLTQQTQLAITEKADDDDKNNKDDGDDDDDDDSTDNHHHGARDDAPSTTCHATGHAPSSRPEDDTPAL